MLNVNVDAIVRLLAERNLSPSRAARLAGFSPSTLTNLTYRKNSRQRHFATVARLAQVLNVDINELLVPEP